MKKAGELFRSTLNLEKHVRIKLLGDSITHGVGGTGFAQNGEPFVTGFSRNPDGYCWANRLKKMLEEKHDCTVVNNACSGTKIEFIIKNFDVLVDEEDDLVLCTIGTNNRHVYFAEGEKPDREALARAFYRNVERLYRMLTEAGKQVIFVANIPASESNEQDGADYWRVLHMQDIREIYQRAAESLGFALIDLYGLFSDYCAREGVSVDCLLADGLHPNDRGYDVIYDLLVSQLCESH